MNCIHENAFASDCGGTAVASRNALRATLVTARRRRREKEKRYLKILNAAARLFCDYGYPTTKIQDIAQTAEVAVGTVYLHFRNKEDLLLHLLDKVSFDLRSYMGKAFGSGKDPVDGFENVGRAFSKDFWRRYRPGIIILFRDSVGVSQEVEARRRAILERLDEDSEAALLEVMRGYGVEDRAAAGTISMAVAGMFERLAYRYVIWEDRSEEVEAVARDVMGFVMGGLMSVLKGLAEAKAAGRGA